jgi:hypothetical protein
MPALSLVVLSCLVLLPSCGNAQDLSDTWVGGTNAGAQADAAVGTYENDGRRVVLRYGPAFARGLTVTGIRSA